MKKILKMLVLGLLSAALLCCALPSAFAAEDKDSQVYTIGLDAGCGACRERKHQNRPRCPRNEAVDEKAGKRRFIQSYIYHI